jgi:hypothetical protein
MRSVCCSGKRALRRARLTRMATRGVAPSPTLGVPRILLRQAVPSTTSMTLSKDTGMMRVRQRSSAVRYLGAPTPARRLPAGQLECERGAPQDPFCHGTLARASRAHGAGEPRMRTGAVVVTPSHVTVKQTRAESLQECLARTVLVSSRTPTLNSELGQHAQRSAAVMSAAFQSSSAQDTHRARGPRASRGDSRTASGAGQVSPSRQVPL